MGCPHISFILNGIWWFVVRGSWFVVVVFYVPTVLYCSTDFLYMCSKKKHKAGHGHKKGHAPRAQDGHSSTGISRPRTEVLRTRAYFSAANTLLRSRASRGHLNLLNGISIVVRSWWSSFFLYLQYCSTDLLYMCSGLEKKKRTTGTRRDTHLGHYKGYLSTGILRARIKELRARTYSPQQTHSSETAHRAGT